MPTTNKEAAVIAAVTVDTIRKKVNEIDADSFDVNDSRAVTHAVFSNLVELAYQTENYSLRQSLFMIMTEIDPTFVPDPEKLNRVVEMYQKIDSDLTLQEFCGLDGKQWVGYTEGCHV